MTSVLHRSGAEAIPSDQTAVPLSVLAAGVAARSSAYVYDLERLRARCRAVQRACPMHKRLFFATMANDHPEILTCIREMGLGVFVNSPGHLALVRSLGFEPSNVVYAASNMGLDDLMMCLDAGVNLVLDSLGQLRALTRLTRGAEVGIRLNVGSALQGDGFRPDPDYRFGLVAEELPEALAVARAAGVRIIGAHSYFGTDVMQPAVLLDGLAHLADAATALPDLRYLDVGGGFGVPDDLGEAEFDLLAYGRSAADLMLQLRERLGRQLELYIEPGRYLAASSGFFFVKVVDLKVRTDRVFVGTNGSVANFPRPLLYPDRARHPCQLVGAAGRAPYSKPAWVCGNSTYSRDFLARDAALPLPAPGDTLVFHNAGAYGRSMITNFLGKDRPREIVLDSAAVGSGSFEEPCGPPLRH